MIVFALCCPKDHQFEGWFRNNQDFDDQCEKGVVSCPICNSKKIQKALMTPNVATRGAISTKTKGSPDARASEMTSKIYDMAQEVRAHVEDNFDYVGSDFPDEARRIHKGDDKERGIYGEASSEDVKALIDEGVDVAPIPDVPTKKSKKKLN